MAGFGIDTPFGGFQFSRSGTNASSDRYFQEKHIRNAIQYRVADAKAAGVNPLFALGAQVQGVSPTGQPSGGSGVKASIKAMTREQEARARKDEAIARYYDSLVARGGQNANTSQDSEGNVITQPSRQLPRLPNVEAKTIPLVARPKVNKPLQSIPLRVEAVGPHGRRKVYNPELGMDELGQVFYGYEVLLDLVNSISDDYVRAYKGQWDRKWYPAKRYPRQDKRPGPLRRHLGSY